MVKFKRIKKQNLVLLIILSAIIWLSFFSLKGAEDIINSEDGTLSVIVKFSSDIFGISPFVILPSTQTVNKGEKAIFSDQQDIFVSCTHSLIGKFELKSNSGLIAGIQEDFGASGSKTAYYKITVNTAQLAPSTYTLESNWICDGLLLGSDGKFGGTDQPNTATLIVEGTQGESCSNPSGAEDQFFCEGPDPQGAGYSVLQCKVGDWTQGFNCVSGYVCTTGQVTNSNPCVKTPACDNDGTCETGENEDNCPSDCVIESCENIGGQMCLDLVEECVGGRFSNTFSGCCIDGGVCAIPPERCANCDEFALSSALNFLFGGDASGSNIKFVQENICIPAPSKLLRIPPFLGHNNTTCAISLVKLSFVPITLIVGFLILSQLLLRFPDLRKRNPLRFIIAGVLAIILSWLTFKIFMLGVIITIILVFARATVGNLIGNISGRLNKN